MTIFHLIKDIVRTQRKKANEKKKQDLGHIEFYRPCTIGRAPSVPH